MKHDTAREAMQRLNETLAKYGHAETREGMAADRHARAVERATAAVVRRAVIAFPGGTPGVHESVEQRNLRIAVQRLIAARAAQRAKPKKNGARS